jgi:hypothetical protein
MYLKTDFSAKGEKEMRKKIRIAATLLFLLALCAVVGVAQQPSPEIGIVKGDANAGELNNAYLDKLTVDQQSTNERIFVIARLGKGETARSLNLNRLKAARSYLVETRGINQEQVIFAEGERVAGEGRVEFYLGGKLMLVSLAERGRNINFNCCEGYIPPKKNKNRKRKG